MSAYSKLRRRRQLFVDAYVRLGCGAGAMRETGYKGKRPEQAAYKILANPEVKAAIAERTEIAITKAGARHVKFVEELCTLAYARLSDIRDAHGKPVTFDKLPADLLAAAESIEFESDGRVKRIRLAKTAGLRMLGELMGKFPQLHEHTGKGGEPIKTQEVSDLEKARRIAHLLTLGLRANTPLSPLPAEGDPDPDDESGDSVTSIST